MSFILGVEAPFNLVLLVTLAIPEQQQMGATTHSIITLSITKLSIITLSTIPLSIMADHCYDECCYAECRYAKCRGAQEKCDEKRSSLFAPTIRHGERKFNDTGTRCRPGPEDH
jgi:hypothetical protein